MPPARLARLLLLMVPLIGTATAARADVGGTLSLQTDARNRGMSYSGNRPSAQLGLSWDGDGGWYAGAQLSRARFGERQSAWLQGYGGRVFEVAPGLDGEVGVLMHGFQHFGRYDFYEIYAGLLTERWSLRVYHANDYYGTGDHGVYGEFNLRWPVTKTVAAVAHAGVVYGRGGRVLSYVEPHGATRADWRLGASWQLGKSSDLQLAWVGATPGGPYTWTDSARHRTVVLGLTTAF